MTAFLRRALRDTTSPDELGALALGLAVYAAVLLSVAWS